MLFVGFFAQPLFPFFRLFWRGRVVSDAYFSIFNTLIEDKKRATPDSILGRYVRWLDRYMLTHSDLVFTDTLQHVEYLKSFFRVPEANVKRLWISAQSEHFASVNPVSYPNEGEGSFRVLFWGGFIPLQGVDIIIQAAEILKDEAIVFDVCGTGQTYDQCSRLVRDQGLRKVNLLGWTAIETIRDMAVDAHLVLGIFGNTEKAFRVIPNKAYEALSMGKPLLTGDSPAARELLTDLDDALLCRMADPQSLADRIRWARGNYDTCRRIGQNGLETFRLRASEQAIGEILRTEVDALLGVSKTESKDG